jgi:hypothetical protein
MRDKTAYISRKNWLCALLVAKAEKEAGSEASGTDKIVDKILSDYFATYYPDVVRHFTEAEANEKLLIESLTRSNP